MDCRKQFIVPPGSQVDLSTIDPAATFDVRKKNGKRNLNRYKKDIREHQSKLAAGKQHALLIIVQGMDTGGKDGVMDTLLESMKSKHCITKHFQKPTKTEMGYNFLWRSQTNLPSHGQVAIWHRSYAEEALVTRVESLYPEEKIQNRYKHMNNFEDLLTEEGTSVLKFFLYMSPEEQWERLQERAEKKKWKVTKNDFEARLKWGEYQDAHEQLFEATSTEIAPWFIIPADHKWFRDYAITQIVSRHLKGLNLEYPEASDEFHEVQKRYLKANDNDDAQAKLAFMMD